MIFPRNRSLTVTAFATAAVLVLSACGRNQPAQEAAAPAAAAAAPAAAPAEPVTPPPADQTAHTPPRAAEPAPVQPAPKPRPKPTTPPAPKPEPIVKTIGTGTDLDVVLLEGASSKTSQVGSAVRAQVTKAVVVDGVTVVAEGAIVHGTVTEAIPLKKIGGTASLGLRFDSLETADGARWPVECGLREQGKSETGKDAGTIAGATAGGALLGRLLSKHDKTKGTLIGAAVGAAAGTGAAAATKGQEVELLPGTPLSLHLEAPLTITVQP